jgi:hypothetical protein
MSNKTALILFVLILISSCFLIFAQENAWKKTVLTNNDQPWIKVFPEVYSADVPDGMCMVCVIKDDNGLLIAAQDFITNTGYFLGIERCEGGFLITPVIHKIARNNLGDKGYNVFKEICLGITPQLPRDVRKKFLGSFGVK